MAIKLMGKKRGMTQRFDEAGNLIVCTVIEVEPNVVTQLKTKAKDGYNAVQLGFEKIEANDPRTVKRRTSKPLQGHYAKAGVEPRRFSGEFRVEDSAEFSLGQELKVDLFKEAGYLDVTGVSKGKGYQGVMKLHNFGGGPAAHGSGFHRHAGSTGMRSTPGRCLPGGKRASHMGVDRVTVENLKIVLVDEENNLILVQGQVPGAYDSLLFLRKARKKRSAK
ncbi:50S ribosomal protein L3 [Parachlamydia sp. AcF125]|uniref:50S ribosomal protein L3 n=1 Tax=Parachlamydia sp. AcF125 TaxID=2795736 RepID=UPI001BCA3659|nr:50S ribosomal protein L3 [Parachlamydia sp. AcF125]MBS4167454.1 50S ribosomal protein L3 [Parachlamydia sp. AcF125]